MRVTPVRIPDNEITSYGDGKDEQARWCDDTLQLLHRFQISSRVYCVSVSAKTITFNRPDRDHRTLGTGNGRHEQCLLERR
jgi:hypothetical protein